MPNHPWLLGVRSSTGFITFACCVAIFTDIFLYGIIIPVIPFALKARVEIAQEHAQRWTSILLSCYSAAMMVSSLLCGWFIDRLSSRRIPFIFALLTLGGSTTFLCVGSSISVLVLGRILEGLSAAFIWTAVPALLVNTVGRKGIGQAMGWVSVSINAAMLLGPFLGGIVFERLGYNAVFYVAFGLISLDMMLLLVLIEKKGAAKWSSSPDLTEKYWVEVHGGSGPPRIEPSSKMLSVFTLGSWETTAAPGTTPGEDREASMPHPTSLGFIRTQFPVVTLLSTSRFFVALWGSLVQALIYTAFDAVLPLFVHKRFGWGSLGAGLIFSPLVIPSLLAPLVGHISDKHGPRLISAIGFLLALPFLTILRLITHDSTSQMVLFCTLLIFVGVCMSLVVTPLMAEVTYMVEDKERNHPGIFGENGVYAQLYGIYFCAFAAGMNIGPIWGGFLVESAGWGTMTLSLGLLSATTAIPILVSTGGPIVGRRSSALD